MIGFSATGTAAPGDTTTTGVTITAAPRWGPVVPGSWTPYQVRLHNGGGVDVDGEVVLIPAPEPPSPGGVAPPTTTSTITSSPSTTVLAIGARAVTGPVPPGAEATPVGAPRWPTYRVPVALSAGADKILSVMVLEASYGYRGELRAGDGRIIATTQAPPQVLKLRTPVGIARRASKVVVLSDVVGTDVLLEALPPQATNGIDATQLPSVQEFPDTALHLAGVDAVLIDDFDTATFTPAQLRALSDYVSLGGALLVTAGAAGSRTLGALPPGLVPLRPTGRGEASLSPLADLATKTTTATATIVVTGDASGARAVLGAPGGPPLVVEANYGAGRVVELTYDPLYEPFVSDGLLKELAWEQGLARSLTRWGNSYSFGAGSGGPSASEDQVWGPTMASPPWPSWPRAEVVILVLFAMATPAAFIGLRRSRRARAWVLVPVGAVVASVACVVASAQSTRAHETVVEVKLLGADGAALPTSYRGLFDLDASERVALVRGAAASTLYSAPPRSVSNAHSRARSHQGLRRRSRRDSAGAASKVPAPAPRCAKRAGRGPCGQPRRCRSSMTARP